MALVLKRNEGESWLDALLRAAKPYGLEDEVRGCYEADRKEGAPEDEAALSAAIEWDIASYEDWTDGAENTGNAVAYDPTLTQDSAPSSADWTPEEVASFEGWAKENPLAIAVDLPELRRLEAAATKGPWRADGPDVRSDSEAVPFDDGSVPCVARAWNAKSVSQYDKGRVLLKSGDEDENAAFIAAARNAVVPLMDEVDRLRKRIAILEHRARK